MVDSPGTNSWIPASSRRARKGTAGRVLTHCQRAVGYRAQPQKIFLFFYLLIAGPEGPGVRD